MVNLCHQQLLLLTVGDSLTVTLEGIDSLLKLEEVLPSGEDVLALDEDGPACLAVVAVFGVELGLLLPTEFGELT